MAEGIPYVGVARVAERVRKQGHDVPENDIRRRYRRSIKNFWTIYRELAHRSVFEVVSLGYND